MRALTTMCTRPGATHLAAGAIILQRETHSTPTHAGTMTQVLQGPQKGRGDTVTPQGFAQGRRAQALSFALVGRLHPCLSHTAQTDRRRSAVRDGMSSSRAPFTWRKVEHLGSHATRWSGLSHCGRCAVMVSADCGLAPCEYRDRNFDFNRPS